MADNNAIAEPEQWTAIAEQLADGFLTYVMKSDIGKRVGADVADLLGSVLGIAVTAMSPIGIALAKGIASSEDVVAPALADLTAAAVSDAFGTQVPSSAFSSKRDPSGRKGAADALGRGLLEQFSRGSSTLEPSTAGAERYLGIVLNMALEGWYQGWMFELMSSLIPYVDVGKIESFADLDDTLAQALGLGRLSRRVLGPVIDATVVTPLEWHTRRTYRPTLLGASAAARQIARHPEQTDKWKEDLRRAGYSDDRIDALLNEQRKFFGVADVRQLTSRGEWTREKGVQHLLDQGYDDDTAETAMRIEGLNRIEQLEAAEGSAIVSAYASGDIDDGTLRSLLSESVTLASERELLTELAHVRRACSARHLTLAQVEAMVRSGVASMLDYRRAATAAGYPDDEVIMLELQLRWEIVKAKRIEQHRADLDAERAAEKAAADAARAQRKAEIDAERALTRRGAEADLERAAVRGLIPIARVSEVYEARYDGDTVAVLVELLEQQRADYVAQLAARDAAAKRAARRDVDVGALEAAVAAGVLTDTEYRARLAALGFSGADVTVLANTLAARLRDQADAQRKRDQAAAAAKIRRIDLARYEILVRRGHRTLAQYADLLTSLGFDDASVAAMRELLQVKIDDDARAADARAAAEARLAARGVSIDQFRRAVVLGIRTIDDYQQFLLDQRFTTDAQQLLLAELRADVDEANAVRQRRAAAEAATDTRALPLSVARQAARLGVISVDAYRDRLTRAGYADEDIALDIDLLVVEMAADAATRRTRDQAGGSADGRGLSLAELARAVKAGVRSIAEYRARAADVFTDPRDVDAVVTLLQLELATTAAAEARRQQIDAELATRDLSIAQLEAAVKGGLKSLDDYYGDLLGMGYSAADAELLATLLGDKLAAAPEAS